MAVAPDPVPQPLQVVGIGVAQLHHLRVDPAAGGAVGVVQVGDPARHARGEVAPHLAQHHGPAPGHVLAAVVAHPLHHRDRPGVADAEPLPHPAPQVDLAAGGAVADHVAGDHVVLGREGGVGRGPHHDPAPRQPLGGVVVGVALQAQGDAPGHERPEGGAGRAGEVDHDGVVGQPGRAPAAGDLVAEHGPHRAVDVADGDVDGHRPALLERRGGHLDQGPVQGRLQPVLLAPHPAGGGAGPGRLGPVQDGGQVQAARLPVVHRSGRVEHLHPAHRLVEAAEPQLGQQLPHLGGDVFEEVHHELGPAGELGPQLGVLGGHPHRAGVEVAHPHHHAAHDHQRGGGEAELLGPQQGGHHHVPAGLELAVDLDGDPVPQVVEHQRLLGLGQPQLPGHPGVLDGGERRGPGAAVVAGDQHHVGPGLRHPGRHRAHPHLGHQLHVDAGGRVGVLEVVDELGQVLDGVDVVVGRGRDQPHAGGGVAGLGDPGVHLVARELAPLPRLGPLGHLDLDVVRADQVFAGHPEAGAGRLLDRAAAGVAVGVGCVAAGVLAALAGVGLGPHAVHGDGQGLVGLGRDGAVAHGPGGEPLDDLACRLDLFEGHRRPLAGAEPEQAPQGAEPPGLVVHPGGVVLEDVVAALAGGVLELEDGLGVEQVVLALPPPLVLAAWIEAAVGPPGRVGREGLPVAGRGLGRQLVQPDAAEAAGGAGEVLLH